MMSLTGLIALLGLSGVFSFFGIEAPIETLEDPVPVEYTCQPHQWVQEPKVGANGVLDARISVSCEFSPLARGGYSMLSQYLQDRVQKEAKKIYAGPQTVTHKGVPAIYFDADMDLAQGSTKVDAREEIFIGLEDQKRVLFDTISKEVRGSGMASYVKGIAIETIVREGTKAGLHSIEAVVTTQIEKPWFVGAKTLESEVKTRTEKEIPKVQKDLISEIAQHI